MHCTLFFFTVVYILTHLSMAIFLQKTSFTLMEKNIWWSLTISLGFPEAKKLKLITTQSVVNTLNAIFAQYGIPQILMDNSLNSALKNLLRNTSSSTSRVALIFQPAMDMWKEWCDSEKTVKDSEDPFLTLLSYVATLPWCRRSPAEFLLGRKSVQHFQCLRKL